MPAVAATLFAGPGGVLPDGLLATGDIGHSGDDGRLYIDGRDDEMIVSGGENVFPGEVEELPVTHEAVADAAAFGVEDDEFGQRLKAYVVLKPNQDVSEADLKKVRQGEPGQLQGPA